jgi:hypothetical protein
MSEKNILFDKLPSELILDILLYTHPSDFIALSHTSLKLRNFIKDNLNYIILSFIKIYKSQSNWHCVYTSRLYWYHIMPENTIDKYFNDFLLACYSTKFKINYDKIKNEYTGQFLNIDNSMDGIAGILAVRSLVINKYNNMIYEIIYDLYISYPNCIDIFIYLINNNIDIISIYLYFSQDINRFFCYINNLFFLRNIGFHHIFSTKPILDNEDIEYMKQLNTYSIPNSKIVPNYKNMIKLLKIGINTHYSYYKSIYPYINDNLDNINNLKKAGFEEEYIFNIIAYNIKNRTSMFTTSNYNNINPINNAIKLKEAGFEEEYIFNIIVCYIKNRTNMFTSNYNNIDPINNIIKLKEAGIEAECILNIFENNNIYNNKVIENIIKLKNLNFSIKFINKILKMYCNPFPLINIDNYIKLKEYGFKDDLFFNEIINYCSDSNIEYLKKLKDQDYSDIDCLYSLYQKCLA